VLGAEHVGLACDATDPDACGAAAGRLPERWGRIDALVNNAGVTQPLRIVEIAPENHDASLDISLRGTLCTSQAVIPAIRAQRAGSLVNFASVSGQRGGGILGGPHY
jgi:NAD(P)-dependent dehydrogenase (short-subunit alcohol dehydrogenase family)